MRDEHQGQKPQERFEGSAGLIHLDQVAGELLELADTAASGRASRTLYRYGPVTVAMFAFRTGGELPAHAADAVVTIQCLRGRVQVSAGDDLFDVAVHGLTRLAPRQVHAVRAESASVILVHIAGQRA
ncbi:MAG: hypothetical protein R3B68_04545 [Phycisphaerales bacterium]